MNRIRRYPGANPFSVDQKDIFFGRQEDINNLFEFISLTNLSVLYAKSGLGKSSLINAGIIPKVEAETDLEVFTIRFGAYTDSTEAMPLGRTQLALQQEEVQPQLNSIIPEENSLWYWLKNHQLHKIQNSSESYEGGFLLVFDQFEELFTYPTEAIEAFARQLSELINTTIPKRFRDALSQQVKGKTNGEENAFFNQLHTPFEVRILMAIRSDRMSLLNQLKSFFPLILKNCYELKELSVIQAEDAILNPAYLPGDQFISQNFDYEDAAIEKIIHFLTQGGEQPIASFQLQIICESVESHVITTGDRMIQPEDLGDLQEVYTNYYMNQLQRIEDAEERLAARRLIEEGLVFEEEERRLSIYEGQILKSYNVSTDLLRKLVDSHLLRAEPSLQGGYTYELSHDTLVAPVLKAKKERQLEEYQAAEIAASEERERELAALRQEAEEERKKRRRARAFAILWFFLAALSLVTSFIAFRQTQLANAAKTEAENQEQLANEQREEAEEQRALALTMSEAAQENAELAATRLEDAERARQQAEVALAAAQRARNEAIQERDRAERATEQVVRLEFNNNVSRVVNLAQSRIEEEPNQAYRLAETAYLLKDTSVTRNTLVATHFNVPAVKRLDLKNQELGCNHVSVFKDGKTIAGAYDYGVAAIWDNAGQLKQVFVDLNSTSYLKEAHISDDGTLLVTASADDLVRIWNASSGALVDYFGYEDNRELESIDISDDNKYIIATFQDSLVSIRDLDQDTTFNMTGHTDNVLKAEILNNGPNAFALSYTSNEIILWNQELQLASRYKIVDDQKIVIAGSLSDSRRVFYLNENNVLRSFDTSNGALAYTSTIEQREIKDAALSPNVNNLVVIDKDNQVWVYNLNTGFYKALPSPRSNIESVAFFPDVTSNNNYDNLHILLGMRSGEVQVLNWAPPTQNYYFGYQDAILTGAFSPNNNYFLTASLDSLAVIWEFATNQPTIIKLNSGVDGATWLEGSETIVAICQDSIARIFNLQGEQIDSLIGHSAEIRSVELSHDGKILATTSEDLTSILWDVQHREKITQLEGHENTVSQIRFSSDDNYLVTVSLDETIKLWDKSGKFIKNIGTHEDNIWDIAFHPDNDMIGTVSTDQTIKLWSIENGLIRTIKGHSSEIYCIAFTNEGNIIATGSRDGTARLWTLEGELIATLDNHNSSVVDIGFSPNDELIYTTSFDRRVKFWHFAPDKIIESRNNDNFFGKTPVLGNNYKAALNFKNIDTIRTVADASSKPLYQMDFTASDTLSMYHFAKFFQRSGDAASSAGARQKAIQDFRNSLDIYAQLINYTDNPYYLNQYGDVEYKIGGAYFENEVYDSAFIFSESSIDIYDIFYQIDSETYASNLANKYGNSSYYALFINQPETAIERALRGLEIDPSQLFIKTNLGHGYLYTNQYEKALETYQSLIGQPSGDPERTFKEILAEDLMILEKRGFSHPDMNRVRQALGIEVTRSNRIQGN